MEQFEDSKGSKTESLRVLINLEILKFGNLNFRHDEERLGSL